MPSRPAPRRLFAVIVTLCAQNRFATNRLPFVAVVVPSCALEDRLKDWLEGVA